MTINTNSILEEVFPFLCKTLHTAFRYQLLRKDFLLVTHTGFEPMLTA